LLCTSWQLWMKSKARATSAIRRLMTSQRRYVTSSWH